MKLRKPTDAELEILRVLWDKGPSTVREVHEELAGTKPVGYTTTLKVMQIMLEKGALTREEKGRGHVYSPSEPKQAVTGAVLTDVIDRVFGGSAADLVLHALGDRPATKEELQEIRALLDSLEAGR